MRCYRPLLAPLFVAFALFVSPALAEEALVIGWENLLPEDELIAAEEEAIADIPLFDDQGPEHQSVGIQTGSSRTVEELDGKRIKMPGFMLPLQYGKGGVIEEFLLVPYFGACIHVPPPPPNQLVYVPTQDNPVKTKGMWDPIWVTGVMRTSMKVNDLGDAAYTLELEKIEKYEE